MGRANQGGRGGKRKWGGNKQKRQRSDETADQRGDDRRGYKLTDKTNELFEEYYKNQPFLSDEDDYNQFLEALKATLPCTFRVTGASAHSEEVLKFIKGEYLSKISEVEVDGKQIKPPTCLQWYPNELAWQIQLDRSFIRHHAPLANLHEFLVSETEAGYISRQEAVSMIPPLLMDIKPHHTVFDMCAAPGSKTAQLIEMLHKDQESTGEIPTGFVIANDADNKRCYLMMHQVKRMSSPNFIIVNHDASNLPNFQMDKEDPKKILKFDRILADVPCSGDGTMRKNPDVWGKWHTGSAHNLHSIQLRILERGVQLLAVGGRLVYSTCSMNPVEDEAVLAAILLKCKGSLELVDVSSTLPGLKYSPGISSWKLLTRDKEWVSEFKDCPEKWVTQIRPSMFPPSPEDAEKLHLDRCLRILPHYQNTGGFFVAVLQKVSEVPWVKVKEDNYGEENNYNCYTCGLVGHYSRNCPENPDAKPDPKDAEPEADTKENTTDAEPNSKETIINPDIKCFECGEVGHIARNCEKRKAKKDDEKRKANDDGRGPSKKKPAFQGHREDPYVFLVDDDPVWQDIKPYYGISDEFPNEQLVVRSHEGKKRNIYFLTKGIKTVLECNKERIKVINGGLKMLVRSEHPQATCNFRLFQDGMAIMEKYLGMGERGVEINSDDIKTLITNENPFLTKMSPATQEVLKDRSPGGMWFMYKPDGPDCKPACAISLSAWLGTCSVRVFMAKGERFHYMRMLGCEIPKQNKRVNQGDARKQATDDSKAIAESTNDGITPEEEHILDCDVKQEPSSNGDTSSIDCQDNELKKEPMDTDTALLDT